MPDTERLHPFEKEKNTSNLPDTNTFGRTSSYGTPNDPNYHFNLYGSNGPKRSSERAARIKNITQK